MLSETRLDLKLVLMIQFYFEIMLQDILARQHQSQFIESNIVESFYPFIAPASQAESLVDEK